MKKINQTITRWIYWKDSKGRQMWPTKFVGTEEELDRIIHNLVHKMHASHVLIKLG